MCWRTPGTPSQVEDLEDFRWNLSEIGIAYTIWCFHSSWVCGCITGEFQNRISREEIFKESIPRSWLDVEMACGPDTDWRQNCFYNGRKSRREFVGAVNLLFRLRLKFCTKMYTRSFFNLQAHTGKKLKSPIVDRTRRSGSSELKLR